MAPGFRLALENLEPSHLWPREAFFEVGRQELSVAYSLDYSLDL
jgi:hypothetical protein